MVYPCDSTVDNNSKEDTEENLNVASNANYMKNIKIYGDAVRETSTIGTDATSWQNNNSYFAGLYHAFILKGGGFGNESYAGRFYFSRSNGDNKFNDGFRSVVIPVLQN